jgi:benzodiazapine receptor
MIARRLDLLALVQSDTWLICTTRDIANSTVIGLADWEQGVALAVVILAAAQLAMPLWIPDPLCSPVGTLKSRQMERLNR